jgi:hypothetical protein
MENIILVTETNLQKVGEDLFKKAYAKGQEEKSYDPYLNTKQLSQLFPYSADWFRDKINQGAFGEKARNGDCMAKYKQVEKYLFQENI